LNNWSHKNDFDTNAYFEKWSALNRNNYKAYKNVFPVPGAGKRWPSLSYIPTLSIPALSQSTPKIKRKIMAMRFFKYCFMLHRPGFFY
jgi:hypothetical protein